MKAARWDALMATWGFGANRDTFGALVAAYGERHRRYHTGEHLDACLAQLDRCAHRADHPHEIELALWFHDAVYRPFASDNEQKSAAWASSFMGANAAPADATARVHALIMATRHDAPPQTHDESLLIDIDLSILGAAPDAYAAFEAAVRQEYAFVPGFVFRRKRAELLRRFLQRPSIFRNEPFASELEARARENMAAAIARLSGRS